MGRVILLWLLGIPIPVLIALAVIGPTTTSRTASINLGRP